MKFSYILHDAGWATAIIEHDERRCEMRVSYVGDAMSMLLNATVDLLSGAEVVRFGFSDEPGGHECVVTRTGADAVSIQVCCYKTWDAAETGDEVFVCCSSVSRFCEAVFVCCKRLLDEHGEEGYKERWTAHEFPTETFERLSRLLYPPRRTAVA